MKRKLLIPGLLALVLGVFPSLGLAANDVTLNTSVELSVNGASLGVTSGAQMDQIVVGSTNFTTTMSSGSTLKVTSGARRKLTVSPSNMLTSETCTSGESSVFIGSAPSATPVVVTVEVSSTTCSGSGSSNGSGGGSVVGVTTSGSSSPAPAPAPSPVSIPVTVTPGVPVTAEQVQKIIASAAALINTPTSSTGSTGAYANTSVPTLFTKNLAPGVTSSDVKRLQQLLNSDPETQIAGSGVGSPGHESNYYGALTVLAVQKFQVKHGLISEGTPSTTGYGALGPKTRAAIEDYLGDDMDDSGAGTMPSSMPSVVPTSVPIVVLTNALSKGKTHSDVKALQEALNSDPDTRIASSGVGSLGNETDFFGAMTEKAVEKFQEKYSIAAPGDPGYGAVGPKTRAKINELFGQQANMQMHTEGEAMMTTPPAVVTGPATDDIQSQINAALKKVASLQSQIGIGGQTIPTAPPVVTPTPVPSNDGDAIQKQIDDAMKKIQEISAQLKDAS